MAMLIVPKLLAYVLLLTHWQTRKQFGGGFLVLVGILVETLLSGLTAPVMMIFQSSAVGEILLGRDAGWQVQRREDGEVSRHDTIHKYLVPTLFGIAMAVSAYAVSLPLLFWMAPVILGLLLAIPIALWSSAIGSKARSRLFATPEQTAPPRVLLRANELANASHRTVGCPLLELRDDPCLLGAHLNNLSSQTLRRRGEIDPHLAIARAKIEDAESFDEATGFLNSRETFAVLNSRAALQFLIGLPWTGQLAINVTDADAGAVSDH
jgi:membrane glycosyltransferase